jgi:hypothetical protein
MIFTASASDVSSLAQSLTHWERAEYAACALVAIACAGEYIASFTDWFTAGDESRKKRLEKRSTLLLIVSLAVELFCLVQTNSISGQLIGSLSDKATNADRKAQSALNKSVDAETKADEAEAKSGEALRRAQAAEDSLAKAEGDARKAQIAAENALATATDASSRATNAEALFGKAEAEAKNALLFAQEANEVAEKLKWRTLSPKQQKEIVGGLLGFIGHPAVEVGSYGMDGEGALLATQIMSVIHKATGAMPKDARASKVVTGGFETGVQIRGPQSEMPFMRKLGHLLQTIGELDVSINAPELSGGVAITGGAALSGGAVLSGGGQLTSQVPATGPVRVFVGLKPIPELSDVSP